MKRSVGCLHYGSVLLTWPLQEAQSRVQATEQQLAAVQAGREALQQQLDQAVELYSVVQGEWGSSQRRWGLQCCSYSTVHGGGDGRGTWLKALQL